MDKQKFKEACKKVISKGLQSKPCEREQSGIGTLGEKTLHAVLKQYFEPDISNHETKIGSFVADIVTDSGIIEIQTRAFDKLRKKLAEFLEISPVTVVYPIPKTKWLVWIDEQTGVNASGEGVMTKKRKSPRQGRIYDVIPELYKIKSLIAHSNFRLCIVFIDMEEYRYLNGWSKDKKKGSTRCDRVPVDVVEEIYINNAFDYINFIPTELNTQFTSKDYKKATNVNMHHGNLILKYFCNIKYAIMHTGVLFDVHYR